MTISVNQQVDFLWKKIGFGVAKTDIPSKKDATNESISSSPYIPGNKIWAESHLIPAIIPTSSIDELVTIYSQATNNAIECTMDITATTNRTWLTGLRDWVPIEFGSTYQVRVFLAPIASTTPETTGIQLYAAGTNNDDEWYFDYEAGVLHFIGTNLPNYSWTGNKIFVCGARYVGLKGLHVSKTETIGNITIQGDTISSVNPLIIDAGGNITVSGSVINSAGYPVLPDDVATAQYVTDVTTQAGIATAQAAATATTQAGIATAQAGIATTQAGIATAQAGIATAKAALLGSTATVTATGTIALTAESAVYQLIDPNGAARDVVLPTLAAGDAGRSFAVKNTGTAGNYLTVKIAAGTQLGPLVANGYSMAVVWSGTAWEVL